MKTAGKLGCTVCVVAVLMAVSASAQASVITYADIASYNAASTLNTIINFNELPSVETWYNQPYVSGGVSITTLTGGMYSMGPATSGWEFLPSVGLECGRSAIIALPANTTAVALNALDNNFNVASFNVVLTIGGVDQPATVVSEIDQAYSFFGATSDQPIQKITVSNSSWGMVDNVTVGTAHIPEPATMTMLILGGLAALLKRKR